jgi:hypothetical protein
MSECHKLKPISLQALGQSAESGRRASGGGSSNLEGPKPNEKAWMARIWADFDVRYMKPFLTHARPTLLDTLPVCCNPIARLLTTTEQLTQVRPQIISSAQFLTFFFF